MIFTIDEEIFGLFPTIKIGVLVCEIDNMRYGDDRLEEVLDDVRAHFAFERPQDHPCIRVWREAYKKMGIPVSKYLSSVEAYLKRALTGGPFPRINPIVDLCNAASLKHLVPVRGHSLDAIDGSIQLCITKGGEVFVPIDLGEQEMVKKGEVVYKDEKEILTRRWVWKQCNKDRIVNETTNVFVTVDIMEGLPDGTCENVVRSLEEGILNNSYGKITCSKVLAKDNTNIEFNF